MNRTASLLAVAALSICVPLTSCTTPDATAIGQLGAQYAAAKYASDKLKSAHNIAEWQQTHDKFQMIHDALEGINAGTLTPQQLRAIIAAEVEDNIEVMILADALLKLAPANATTTGIQSEWIRSVTSGLALALMGSPPPFKYP